MIRVQPSPLLMVGRYAPTQHLPAIEQTQDHFRRPCHRHIARRPQLRPSSPPATRGERIDDSNSPRIALVSGRWLSPGGIPTSPADLRTPAILLPSWAFPPGALSLTPARQSRFRGMDRRGCGNAKMERPSWGVGGSLTNGVRRVRLFGSAGTDGSFAELGPPGDRGRSMPGRPCPTGRPTGVVGGRRSAACVARRKRCSIKASRVPMARRAARRTHPGSCKC